ncbi:hypothetical protein INS49_015619 [Diaporthe citri]|uniref:uncharacterized protein n=1 Tax=Diaporthe citri TaxID=83186 RepID=UPI001C7F0350|nr:uncharacterized protein INS49_015619 [Diaporthe citri]KAG6356232.1 hypothetical protein INS49_015619 [Diaporthe citri]
MQLDTPELIHNIAKQAEKLATHSWEYGTLAQSLLEVFSPDISVFSARSFPHSRAPVVDDTDTNRGLTFGKRHIKLDQPNLTGDEDSAADPASLGVVAVLLGQVDPPYMAAAERQFATLVENTPRMGNGAISHKVRRAETWSDSVYMVPPFLAYYGMAKLDLTTIETAVKQCQLYAELLQDPVQGLWRHINGEHFKDGGFWSTGNGWAALGMTRVLATLVNGGHGRHMIDRLLQPLKRLLDGVLLHPRDSANLVRNYIGDREVVWFGEVAGTAALTAVMYRVATLFPSELSEDHMAWTESSRVAVMQHVDSETGKASPVVNMMDTKDPEPQDASAEGQCFTLMMYAAHRDWLEAQAASGLLCDG